MFNSPTAPPCRAIPLLSAPPLCVPAGVASDEEQDFSWRGALNLELDLPPGRFAVVLCGRLRCASDCLCVKSPSHHVVE